MRKTENDPKIDPATQPPASDQTGAGEPPENTAPPAAPAAPATDNVPESEKAGSNELTKGQKSTLKRLQDMPKRRILIPFDPLNPSDVVVPIAVNGVTYAIPRGKAFDVPEVIADIWEESYQKTQAAQQRIKVQVPDEIVITR